MKFGHCRYVQVLFASSMLFVLLANLFLSAGY